MEMFLLLLMLLLVPAALVLLLGWLSVEFFPLWMLCLQLNLLCRMFRAYDGNLQACKAFLMCSISLCGACWLVETTLALCGQVLKTLCFAMMKWLLSHVDIGL